MPTNVNINKLSDEQIERLLLAINEMKETNTMAGLIAKALEKQQSLIDKRRVLITSFSQCFELMVVMNMAIEAKVKPDEFKNNLADIRRLNHAGSN